MGEFRLSKLRGLPRRLRDDLWGFAAAPLPPLPRPRLLRWAPHVLFCDISIALALGAGGELRDTYGLAFWLGTATGLIQGGAVALALWYPLPAWWLSLAAFVVASHAAPQMRIPYPRPPVAPQPWPWTGSAITACVLVLFLLALRLPTRVCVSVWGLTALATYLTEGVEGGGYYSATGLPALVIFAAALLVGSLLRARREARTQIVALTTVSAEERARRTLLEERSRIARELHDVVAHHMSVISIQAQVAPHLVENPSDELRENLDGIRANALEALAELRRVLGVLRSEDPGDPYGIGSGTGAAPDSPQPTLDRLDALVENTRAAGLEVRTEITGQVRPLPSGVELSAYRIIQEALSNALRHAPGSTVKAELAYIPEGLHVRVANSRPTSPAPPSPGAGHGLLGMRERAAMLGGTLATFPTGSGGYEVQCFLPSPGGQDSDSPTALPAPSSSPQDDDPTGPTTPAGENNR
ncbi:sensor histidine kinase [Streptomyces sp. NPDC047022]|uniref:sensor histidine kinase n=1 Tax=Streptomyces sp. NPDC047022 TaxID=3155737 RepID=UPI0033D1837B